MNDNTIKERFNRKLITEEEVSNQIAEENGFDKKTLWFIHQQFEMRKLQYIMNGVAVKGLLGTIEHVLHKAREVKGLLGEISMLPERFKIKIKFPERFDKVYEQHDYYDLFTTDMNNELIINITKDTPKIKEGEATYWGCLKVMADVLWKGEIVITVENIKELEELTIKLNEFVSEEREIELEEKIKENSDAKKLRELRKELKILKGLKQNLVSNRILIINNEKANDLEESIGEIKIEGEM